MQVDFFPKAEENRHHHRHYRQIYQYYQCKKAACLFLFSLSQQLADEGVSPGCKDKGYRHANIQHRKDDVYRRESETAYIIGDNNAVND